MCLRASSLKVQLDFENSEENLIIWIQGCSKPISKYFIDYLKTNLRKSLVTVQILKNWWCFQSLKYCFKYFFKKEQSLKMPKTALVTIVVLLHLFFSGPDTMLCFLPVLAVGPVIILLAVTEENWFLCKTKQELDSCIWSFNCFSSKLGCVYCS